MSVSHQCLPRSPLCHSNSLDRRRVQALRAPPTPLLDLSAERSSARSSPPTVTCYMLEHSLRSPSSSLGGSFPSLFSPNSPSSHPATFGSQHLTHRVTAGTQQSGHPPHHLNPVSHLRYGEGFSSLRQSNNKVPPLPQLTSTPPKGSCAMVPPNGFRIRPTTFSSHCSPMNESTSESRQPLNYSNSAVAALLPSSPMTSPTSSRRTSGSYINKSVQNLLRRGKTKEAKSGAYPLNNNSTAVDEPRAHQFNSSHSLTKPAVLSPAYAHSMAHSSCRSSSSYQSINSLPQLPLRYNANAAEQESLQRCSTSDSSLKSSRSFYSSVDSDASYSPATPTFSNSAGCLPGGHSHLSGSQTAIFTGALPVSDKLDFVGDHANVKFSIAKPSERLNPSIEVTEESDGDESEIDDIMANLRSIAASRSLKTQQFEFDSHSSLDRNMSSDQYSVDYSDSGSEFSFDAAADEEEGPDYFPLPSWPTLGSTSQSPLNKQLSNSSIRLSPGSFSTPVKESTIPRGHGSSTRSPKLPDPRH